MNLIVVICSHNIKGINIVHDILTGVKFILTDVCYVFFGFLFCSREKKVRRFCIFIEKVSEFIKHGKTIRFLLKEVWRTLT